jgi:hypothetical protein
MGELKAGQVQQWSVGMAVFDRPAADGVFPESLRAWYTTMSLRTHHPEVGEVIVVDNNPNPKSPLPALFAKLGGWARYVPMPSPQGTAPPRNRVFEEAKFNFVACLDAHELIHNGSFAALNEFYARRGPECQDLAHGLMMNEDGTVHASHMNDQWRAEMWGTWGVAWVAPKNGLQFSVLTRDNQTAQYVTLNCGPVVEQHPLSTAEIQAAGLPFNLPWPGHEQKLYAAGCAHPQEPFTAPGHGMGFFACRKDAWLPFHPQARGFGGEEMTTGYRFRQAGRLVWVVPGCRWWHDYHKPAGTPPYPLTLWDKVRNYVLEFKRLGLDLGPVRQEFPAGRLPESDWQQIIAGADWPAGGAADVNPGTYAGPPPGRQAGTVYVPPGVSRPTQAPPPAPRQPAGLTLDALFSGVTSVKGIGEDAPALRALAASCGAGNRPGRVVELGTHQGLGTTALMAGRPTALVTFTQGGPPPPRVQQLLPLVPEGMTFGALTSEELGADGIPECDLLFLNTEPHSAEGLWQNLTKYGQQAQRYVAVHGTTVYGEKYNQEPGLLPGIRGFLQTYPEWCVVAHQPTGLGLTVLSRLAGDCPNPPVDISPGKIPPPQPAGGPGTEMKAILASVGIVPDANCECNGRAAQMDAWGVAGCRRNFHAVVGFLKDGAERWGWAAAFAKAALHPLALVSLAMRVNWTDPLPGIVTESIRRAEEKGFP